MSVKTILVVYHSQGGTMASMARALADGAAKIEGVEVLLKRAAQATTDDLLACDGLALGTPEYFGYMSGAIKDFFDRCYEQAKDRTFRLPYVLMVCAGNDGRGAIASVERIAVGFKWKQVAESPRVVGSPDADALAAIDELGQTLAAGVEAGIF